ncbi:hypothetical protein BKA57DRAFT_496636, partial [Linnemannia elongata]
MKGFCVLGNISQTAFLKARKEKYDKTNNILTILHDGVAHGGGNENQDRPPACLSVLYLASTEHPKLGKPIQRLKKRHKNFSPVSQGLPTTDQEQQQKQPKESPFTLSLPLSTRPLAAKKSQTRQASKQFHPLHLPSQYSCLSLHDRPLFSISFSTPTVPLSHCPTLNKSVQFSTPQQRTLFSSVVSRVLTVCQRNHIQPRTTTTRLSPPSMYASGTKSSTFFGHPSQSPRSNSPR